MSRRRTAALLAGIFACLLGAFARGAEAQETDEGPDYWGTDPNLGLGLFQSISLSPLPSLRTGLGPRPPSSLAESIVELHVNEDWARMLSVKDRWLLDYDVLRSEIGFSWGVTDRLRLDLDIESATRTSGYLETFIIAFHRTFDLALGDRRQFSHHPQTIQIRIPPAGPTLLVDEHDPQPYTQSAIASADYTLVRGTEGVPTVAGSLSIRRVLTAGDVSLGSPVDLGASLSLAKSAGPVNVYAAGSMAWFGEQDFSGLPLRSVQWSGVFGVEVRAVSWFSVTAQYLITSGGADSLGDLSRPSHEVTAGFKWDLGRGFLLETAILENIVNPNNSPDFGVHFDLTIRW